MSDTSSLHAHDPALKTEADGVNYRGLVWFMVILFGTTIVCQIIVWGMFGFMTRQAAKDDALHPSLAAPFGEASANCVEPPLGDGVGHTPCIMKNGQVDPGRAKPQPNLMADDPLGLKMFREEEDQKLQTYGVMDKNAGTYRIPVDRAKELLLQRGISGGTAMMTAAPTEKTEPAAKPPLKIKK